MEEHPAPLPSFLSFFSPLSFPLKSYFRCLAERSSILEDTACFRVLLGCCSSCYGGWSEKFKRCSEIFQGGRILSVCIVSAEFLLKRCNSKITALLSTPLIAIRTAPCTRLLGTRSHPESRRVPALTGRQRLHSRNAQKVTEDYHFAINKKQ